MGSAPTWTGAPAHCVATVRERAEIELLLRLARARLDPADAARARELLLGTVAWDEFVDLAARHRLLPICVWHLQRIAPDLVPPGALRSMRGHAATSARRSLLLASELRNLLGAFNAAGIPALAYKGPVLAQSVYGSVTLRDVVDLDIVVPKSEAVRARVVLMGRGYRSASPVDSRWERYLLRSGCNFPVVQDAKGVVVELHWRPETSISERVLAELLERQEEVPLGGSGVPTFAREDLVVLLCLHGCRHLWERLEWVADISELVRIGGFCWGEALRLARMVGGRRALFVGLILARDVLDAPVPAEILVLAEADRRASDLARAAAEHLFAEAPVLAHEMGLPFHLFQVQARERVRDRVRYLGHHALALSPDEREAIRAPWHLFRIYSALHRLRFIGALGARLLRPRASVGALAGEAR